MVYLYILIGILIFFILILFVPVSLGLTVNEQTGLYVKIGFIKIGILPKKKKKLNIKKYTPKALQKKQEALKRKEEKKRLKKAKKKQKKKVSTTNKNKSRIAKIFSSPSEMPDFLSDAADLIVLLTSKFSRRLKVRILSCNIRIGSDNAAKTALLYGGICSGINALSAFLSQFTRYDEKDIENVNVYPDFLYEKLECEIHIRISLRPGQIFTFLFSALPEILRIYDYL